MIRTSDEIPQNEHNERRMERARSWLAQSGEVEAAEEKFICLWIAFNAAYGGELTGMSKDDPQKINKFLRKILYHDEQKEKKIKGLLYDSCYKDIRDLLGNRYVFKTFWQYVRGEPKGADWSRDFKDKNDSAWRDFENGNVFGVFKEVFWRLYQLRNQVIHGGVIFGKGWGRSQLEQGCLIMKGIVPVILEVMDENPKSDWGKVAYPRVGESPD